MFFWSKKQPEKASLRVMPRITPPAPTVIAPNSVTWRDYMNIKDEVKKLREKEWETMEKWMEADTNGVKKYAAKNQELEKLVRGLRHQVDEYAAKSQAVQPQLQESESMVALLIDELFRQQQGCCKNQKARAAEKTALELNIDALILATANDRRDITQLRSFLHITMQKLHASQTDHARLVRSVDYLFANYAALATRSKARGKLLSTAGPHVQRLLGQNRELRRQLNWYQGEKVRLEQQEMELAPAGKPQIVFVKRSLRRLFERYITFPRFINRAQTATHHKELKKSQADIENLEEQFALLNKARDLDDTADLLIAARKETMDLHNQLAAAQEALRQKHMLTGMMENNIEGLKRQLNDEKNKDKCCCPKHCSQDAASDPKDNQLSVSEAALATSQAEAVQDAAEKKAADEAAERKAAELQKAAEQQKKVEDDAAIKKKAERGATEKTVGPDVVGKTAADETTEKKAAEHAGPSNASSRTNDTRAIPQNSPPHEPAFKRPELFNNDPEPEAPKPASRAQMNVRKIKPLKSSKRAVNKGAPLITTSNDDASSDHIASPLVPAVHSNPPISGFPKPAVDSDIVSSVHSIGIPGLNLFDDGFGTAPSNDDGSAGAMDIGLPSDGLSTAPIPPADAVARGMRNLLLNTSHLNVPNAEDREVIMTEDMDYDEAARSTSAAEGSQIQPNDMLNASGDDLQDAIMTGPFEAESANLVETGLITPRVDADYFSTMRTATGSALQDNEDMFYDSDSA
ncbi:hypothetical protein LTS18_005243, partial [Coniosporium uncinatum]